MIRDIDKVCRWCRHFEFGKCYRLKSAVEVNNSSEDLYCLVESGRMDAVLEENYSIPKEFVRLDRLLNLEYGLSKKRQKEILQAIINDLDEYKEILINDISNAIALIRLDEKEPAFEILDPEQFSCAYWE